MSETFELRIDSLAAGGDGVGRHEGLVVFVPRSAPGDVALIRGERRGRLMRGALLELREASPDRVTPPCPHYAGDRCGGCQLQHLRYDAQLDGKARIIRDAMTRIGRVAVQPPVVESSATPWRYRSKLTLALRRRDDAWFAGLHRYDAPDEVFELRDCLITDERVVAAWRRIMTLQRHLPAARSLRGAVRLVESGIAFTLEGGTVWPESEALFEAMPDMRELWWQAESRPRRLLHAREQEHGAGASFSQVNAAMSAEVRAWIVARARAAGPETAVDAYAGAGHVAAALGSSGVRVTAIEIDRDAARVGAARLAPGSRMLAASVEGALEGALPADVVILNPPRAGLHERVTEILSTHAPAPRLVLYVSCDPATLARDVRRLEGYAVRSLRAFDMFPQTAHVETVCELVPAA